MLRQLRPALVLLGVFTVVCGLAYPLAVTASARILFADEADGSRIEVDGRPAGSALLAQPFTGREWFHPRPSAVSYDAEASGGSNLGPSNPELLAQVRDRIDTYRRDNGLSDGVAVPVDAVTASGSGLDPHISERNARLQAARVADERGVRVDVVLDLVERHTSGRALGVLGESRVNVVLLNAALERLAP